MINNIYRYGFLSVCGAVVLITLYLAAYGAIDRSYAFAQWMTGIDDARVMTYCNEGDNMTTKAVCTGATVEVE